MPRISTSSWSLHRALGKPPMRTPDGPPANGPAANAQLSLLDLPDRLAAAGIGTLEICHFHFPHTDASYLAELRAAAQDAGVELFSVLIDAGDITHSDPAQLEKELDWIRGWLDVAAAIGASHSRVIAGYAPIERNGGALRDHPLIQRSAANLRGLAAYGAGQGVRVITENFRATAARADQLLAILELCAGAVGTCADFGNFPLTSPGDVLRSSKGQRNGPDKYDELAAIAPQAHSAHAKALYDGEGHPDRAELIRCLDVMAAAGFDGPVSLIFDTPFYRGEDEWDNLARLREIVQPYII
ncbi:MAG: sugar phosphate isomerase/epimerase [Caldilineaceae bacterium]|nr:sugar phosphate isomerase/epimerase [Caldilineaceae bacterium]